MERFAILLQKFYGVKEFQHEGRYMVFELHASRDDHWEKSLPMYGVVVAIDVSIEGKLQGFI